MKRTVVAVFEQVEGAQRAAQALRAGGLADGRVQVSDSGAVPPPHEAEEGMMAYVRSFLAEVLGPHDEHHVGSYADALRRGHAVVRVDVQDEHELDTARQAFAAAGALTVDERRAG